MQWINDLILISIPLLLSVVLFFGLYYIIKRRKLNPECENKCTVDTTKKRESILDLINRSSTHSHQFDKAPATLKPIKKISSTRVISSLADLNTDQMIQFDKMMRERNIQSTLIVQKPRKRKHSEPTLKATSTQKRKNSTPHTEKEKAEVFSTVNRTINPPKKVRIPLPLKEPNPTAIPKKSTLKRSTKQLRPLPPLPIDNLHPASSRKSTEKFSAIEIFKSQHFRTSKVPVPKVDLNNLTGSSVSYVDQSQNIIQPTTIRKSSLQDSSHTPIQESTPDDSQQVPITDNNPIRPISQLPQIPSQIFDSCTIPIGFVDAMIKDINSLV